MNNILKKKINLRIENFFNSLFLLFKSDKKSMRMKRIFKLLLKEEKIDNIASDFNLSKERARQIKAAIIRKIKSKFNSDNIIELFNLINCSFTFDQRWMKTEVQFINLLKMVNYNKFFYFEDILIESNYFNYMISKIKSAPFEIKSSFISQINNKDEFYRIYLGNKTFNHNGNIYMNKHTFLISHAIKWGIIDVEKDFAYLKDAIGGSNIRAFSSNLERYKYLIKIEKNKFLYKNDEIIDHFSAITLGQVKKCVYEENIYKFNNIKEMIHSQSNYRYPGDSLYYILKEYAAHSFNFDKGNRKIVFPISKQVMMLEKLLDEKYPKGIKKININDLIKEGFSKDISINSKVIFNSNIYISKKKIKSIKKELLNIFNSNRAFYHMDEILENSSQDLKYLFSNSNMKLQIASWFPHIVMIRRTFIDIKKEYDLVEETSIVSFIGNYIIYRYSLDEFSKLEEIKGTQLSIFLNAKSHMVNKIYKYMYFDRDIGVERKKIIKEYISK